MGEEYNSPMQDDAPWTDPDDLDTYDFWGCYPLDVTGIEDATVQVPVIESTLDGGRVGRARRSTKPIVSNLLLVGRSDCAVEAGLRWLKSVFGGNPCEGPSSCSGNDLCYFSCEPCIDWTTCGIEPPPRETGGPTSLGIAAPYNDEMFQVGHTGALDPVITGSGLLGDGSDATYVKVQHTTSTSYAAADLTGFTLPADATVQNIVVTVRVRGNSNHPTPSASYRLHADLTKHGAVFGAPTPMYFNGWGAVNPGQVPMNDTFTNLTYTINQADVTAQAAPGFTTLRQVADLLATGATVHFWVSTPSGYTSYADIAEYGVTVNYTVPVWEPMVTVEDCGDRYLRSLRKVGVTNGPTVTGKQRMTDGGAAWLVGVTMTAGNPYEYSAERRLIKDFLKPGVTNPYVPSAPVMPNGSPYPFNMTGSTETEADCPVRVYAPLEDPNCPQTVLPPSVPQNVTLACFDFPATYRRRSFVIPAQTVPLWTDVVPYLVIRAKQEVRSLRLRFYPDVLGGMDPSDDPCAYCGDIVFSYIPARSTLVFDGTDEVVYVERGGGVRQRADTVTYDSDGGPFEWPQLTCGYSYIVAIDLPKSQDDNLPVIDFSLYARVA
jgi:hypothetical protein